MDSRPTRTEGFFWMSITDQSTPNQYIPIDVVKRYLIDDIAGFDSPVQIICNSWQNIVNILAKIGISLPVQLSEAEAMELYDYHQSFVCTRHQLNYCDTCDTEYHERQKIVRLTELHNQMFQKTPVFDRVKAYEALFPSGLYSGPKLYKETSIGMLQISYLASHFCQEGRPYWTVDQFFERYSST